MYEKSRNLFDCNIAGFTYYDGLDVIDKLVLGAAVTLVPEPDNPYDPDAVAVYFEKSKLGFIPQTLNGIISSLFYFGHGDIFEAKICSRNLESHMEKQFSIVVKIKDNRA